MSDVSGLYKSCVSHLDKWTTLFAEFKNACARFLRLQTTNWEKDETCEWYLCDRNVSTDEAEVNYLTNTCSSSCKTPLPRNA